MMFDKLYQVSVVRQLFPNAYNLLVIFIFLFLFILATQADWKPESPDKFGEIAELAKSIDTLKVGETRQGLTLFHYLKTFFNLKLFKFILLVHLRGLYSGHGPKSTMVPNKAPPANPPAQKPAAYRPPHAKTTAAIQAEVHKTIHPVIL